MSIDEAEAIQSYYESTDAAKDRRSFISRMERKMHRRSRLERP